MLQSNHTALHYPATASRSLDRADLEDTEPERLRDRLHSSCRPGQRHPPPCTRLYRRRRYLRRRLGAGAQITPVPVDPEGLVVEVGIAWAPQARLVYATPSHQFPLGATMSPTRRLSLLEWARCANAYILEDDYDSEYRFAGRPLAALQGLDVAERVIYVGTFSRILFPALRIGYLVVPPPLVAPFLTVRGLIDFHPPILEQAVLAERPAARSRLALALQFIV